MMRSIIRDLGGKSSIPLRSTQDDKGGAPLRMTEAVLCEIKITGSTGGLHSPYKGLLPA